MILERLTNSQELAFQLMDAAQRSNHAKVDEIIRSTGVTAQVNTSFTPDGLRLELSSAKQETDCCRLTMYLRW